MKKTREVLLKWHRSVEPKLDRMWDEALAPELRSEASPANSGLRSWWRRRPCLRSSTWASTEARPTIHEHSLFAMIVSKLWRELIWPSRRIWAGLAVAWLVILGLNLASSDSSARVVSKTEPRSREEIRALIEQRRMLALLIGPMAEPATERKSNPPGPRSDRTTRISAA